MLVNAFFFILFVILVVLFNTDFNQFVNLNLSLEQEGLDMIVSCLHLNHLLFDQSLNILVNCRESFVEGEDHLLVKYEGSLLVVTRRSSSSIIILKGFKHGVFDLLLQKVLPPAQ